MRFAVLLTSTAIIALCNAAVSAEETDKLTPDFFLTHVQKHLNQSISPCDNFYRHVCPKDFPHANDYVSKLIKEIKTIEREGDEDKALMLAFCEPDDKRQSIKLCRILTDLNNNLRVRSYLAKNSLDSKEYIAEIQAIVDGVKNISRSQVEKNFQFTNETRLEMEEELNRIAVQSLLDNVQTKLDAFQSLYDRLMHLAWKLNASGLLLESDMLITLPETMGGITLDKLDMISSVNGMNTNGTVDVNSGYLMLTLQADPFVRASVLSRVLGHEVHHSLISKSIGLNDISYQEKRECVQNHTSDVCREFGQDEVACGGGRATFDEDGPDVEGYQAAFLNVQRIYGDQFEKIYHGNISYKQMFFYSLASSYCVDFPTNGVHAANFVRINSVFSLMNSFLDTFQCKKDTAMAKLAAKADEGKCNLFGDAV